MNLVYVLKLCVLGAFAGTLLTGVIFMIHSSDEQQIRTHAKDIYGKIKQGARRVPSAEGTAVGEPPPPQPPAQSAIRDEIEGGVAEQVQHNADRHGEKNAFNVAEAQGRIKSPVVGGDAGVVAPVPIVTTTTSAAIKEAPGVPAHIHIFYYPWYGSPVFNDGRYWHWNHRYLPPWDATDKHEYPKGRHEPPRDVASSFYPSLGAYSSWDAEVVERHMKWLSSAGIDVLVVSWYPKNKADAEGTPWDSLIPTLLNATEKHKMKLTFHLEPYDGRTVETLRTDIVYLIDEYGKHPAFYRTKAKGGEKELPLLYIYDSYRIAPSEWMRLTMRDAVAQPLSIRGTAWDSLLVGLLVKKEDAEAIKQAGLDGVYTYFASDGFSYGSTATNWQQLSEFCAKEKLLFIPSVGPGYNDTAVRPWNTKATKERAGGDYYREHWKAAYAAKPDILSITSFNEWHEGTQIEPAANDFPTTPAPISSKPPTTPSGSAALKDLDTPSKPGAAATALDTSAPSKLQAAFGYERYEKGPEQYLEITREMINQYFTAHRHRIEAEIAKIV